MPFHGRAKKESKENSKIEEAGETRILIWMVWCALHVCLMQAGVRRRKMGNNHIYSKKSLLMSILKRCAESATTESQILIFVQGSRKTVGKTRVRWGKDLGIRIWLHDLHFETWSVLFFFYPRGIPEVLYMWNGEGNGSKWGSSRMGTAVWDLINLGFTQTSPPTCCGLQMSSVLTP